jgi:hypothetical protein
VSGKPRHIGLALAAALSGLFGGIVNSGKDALDFFAQGGGERAPTFGQRYGSSPKRHNGGKARHCAAQDKRAARSRANLRKHPRCANGWRKSP